LSKSAENGFGAASRCVSVDERTSKLPQSDFYRRLRRVLSQGISTAEIGRNEARLAEAGPA